VTKLTVMIVINLDILNSMAQTPPVAQPERLLKWPQKERILPKNVFNGNVSNFWQKFLQTVTSFKTFGLGVKVQ
jgi:hypothetical protein